MNNEGVRRMGLCRKCKGMGNTYIALGGEVKRKKYICDNCGGSYYG